jgi:Fic family protein
MKHGIKMNELLNKIEAKRKKLQRLLVNKNKRKVLTDWLMTELAYTSNAIEGNTLTRKETALAISENITSGAKPIKDYQEAINHSSAFEYILTPKLAPDETTILGIHSRILSGIDDRNAGRYRDVRVRISHSATILPNPLKAPDLMHEFNKWLGRAKMPAPLKAIDAHYRLVSIHPFIDGNGRASRLLMNMILIQNGYAPIIIRKIDRRRYLAALEKYQVGGDAEQYEKFMLGALSKSLSMAIDLLDNDQPDLKGMLTITKFAVLAGLPASTIRYWVQTKKLQPAAYSASGYMLFDKGQLKGLGA